MAIQIGTYNMSWMEIPLTTVDWDIVPARTRKYWVLEDDSDIAVPVVEKIGKDVTMVKISGIFILKAVSLRKPFNVLRDGLTATPETTLQEITKEGSLVRVTRLGTYICKGIKVQESQWLRGVARRIDWVITLEEQPQYANIGSAS